MSALDENETPMQGLFAYVNPDALTTGSTETTRMFLVAFDFSDSTEVTITTRVERYDTNAERYAVYQIHYQCNQSTDQCISESLEVQSPVPDREISPATFRMSWDSNTNEICDSSTTITSDEGTVLGPTQSFTGPGAPNPDDVGSEDCTIATPVWSDHSYSASDLISRYGDTDPELGLSGAIYSDGTSLSGWEENLPVTIIENWPVGTF